MENEEKRYTEKEVFDIIREGLISLNKKFTKKERLTSRDMYIIGAVSLSFKEHKEKQVTSQPVNPHPHIP